MPKHLVPAFWPRNVMIAASLETAIASSPSLWDHNSSTVYLIADGAKREFRYDQPRPGMLEAGGQPGSLLFTGRAVGGRYFGTAYIFSPECGLPYQVSGPILDNDERVVLKGQAPRLDADCRIVGYYTDVLEFSLLKPARTTSNTKESYAYAPLPGARLSSEFTGVWILANEDNNQCRKTDWKGVAASANDRLVSITPRVRLRCGKTAAPL